MSLARRRLGPRCVASALAVGTSNWTQTSEADWKAGTFDNVVATNLGDLKLSRAVKTVLEQDEQVSSVNALAEGPDGTIYAGTGPRGVLLKVKGDDVSKLMTVDDATGILSLLVDKRGPAADRHRRRLGPGARGSDHPEKEAEKPTEVFKAEGVQYVWQIRQTPDGNLYAATGPTREAVRDQAGRLAAGLAGDQREQPDRPGVGRKGRCTSGATRTGWFTG